jgi:tRNA dimethylallyltransferase
VGPTASGKSQLALDVAARAGDAEIVSLDSMQVYRGLDVGTAKPSAADRTRVRHHLVDVAEPDDDWSVARTQQCARAAVAAIERRGRRAVLVGGTGLYVQAVIDAFDLPGEDLALRAELEVATSESGGLLAAWQELQRVDPDAAARIDEHNQRRIVRALEVIRLTGRPFSSFGPGVFAAGETAFPVLLAGVWLPRDVLAARIAARVDAMRANGLLDEVRQLAPRLGRAAAQAIGYKELLDVVHGRRDEDDAFDLVVRRTRSFARRQRMWFRRDPRIVWAAPGGAEIGSLAEAVLACWRVAA